MSLFGNKNKEQTPGCACNDTCSTSKTTEIKSNGTCCSGGKESILNIQVFGTGCKNCHALLVNTQKAVAEMGLEIRVEYITDLKKIMEHGIMSMPALAVNNRVIASGKVYKPDDLKKLLHNLGY